VSDPQPYVPPVLPEVDHLPSTTFFTTFAVILGAVPDDIKNDRRFLWTYVHLVRVIDKAIREYTAARDAALKAAAITFDRESVVPPNALANKGHYVMLVTDHLETCLDATHRAVAALALLRTKGIGTSAKPLDSDAVERLKDIRDAMQHTPDRLIAEGLRRDRRPFGPEDPYGIQPAEHHVTIGAERPLTYVELVNLMEKCYRASEIIGGRPSTA
jgi:hypothetical protein